MRALLLRRRLRLRGLLRGRRCRFLDVVLPDRRWRARPRSARARSTIFWNMAPVSPPSAGRCEIQIAGLSSARMSAKSRSLLTLSGANSAMSTSPAQSSRCLISSHDRPSPPLPPHPPLRAHEHPRSLQLEPVERELQVALLQRRVDIVDLRRPRAAVPQHHDAGAVAGRESRLRNRRIRSGDPRRASPGAWFSDRVTAPWDGPRQQHAVVLEAEVVVQVAGEVLLHAEEPRRAGRPATCAASSPAGSGDSRSCACALYFSSAIVNIRTSDIDYAEHQLTPPINCLKREERANMTMPATIGRMLTAMKQRGRAASPRRTTPSGRP